MRKRKLMEYIDGNEIFNVNKEIIEDWIHKLEGDLSILKGELLRRESGVSQYDWEHGKDLLDKFGLPIINRKDRN
jgi:hypothetical protein